MKFYQVFLSVLCSYQIHFLAGSCFFFVQVAVVLLVGAEQGSSLYILVVILGLA